MRYIILFLLLSFSVQAQTAATFPPDFLFGIANAPGHVEDQLDDIWMDFGAKGKIKAFQNQDVPEDRLKFWTQPEIEIDLAHELGTQIFRLGVDWGRIHTAPGVFDEAAISRYREILGMIRKKDMKIMLTLFHFTVPKWIQNEGGWTNPKTQAHFVEFSKKVMSEYSPMVDFWITFNEPQIFATMAYSFGFFPSGKFEGQNRPLSVLNIGPIKGRTKKALNLMIASHKEIYTWAHQNIGSPKIGIAQHMGYHSGKTKLNKLLSKFTGSFMNWFFPERIKGYMDYFGFNYYGAEWIKGASIAMDDSEEYSEAGRAINPRGLYLLSKEIQKRFPTVPQFITENGIADSTDWLRPAYLIEHLMAVQQLQRENVDILGYIHWTITDNMEWSDGYCPKFGLVSVDRKNNLLRIKRPSFDLYQNIIKNHSISSEMRNASWDLVQSHVGEARPFCRSNDGRTGLDVPEERLIRSNDWRF
jgi:beta-glucosidase/6-phospho-beta-glucosidase/beta-galactosidase